MTTDARFTECCHNINAEKWHPTYEKNAHYNANCYGRLVIGYMIRWWMMQMTYFKFLFRLSAYTSISVLLFLHDFTTDSRPSHSSYRFYMLLCITIQSVWCVCWVWVCMCAHPDSIASNIVFFACTMFVCLYVMCTCQRIRRFTQMTYGGETACKKKRTRQDVKREKKEKKQTESEKNCFNKKKPVRFTPHNHNKTLFHSTHFFLLPYST